MKRLKFDKSAFLMLLVMVLCSVFGVSTGMANGVPMGDPGFVPDTSTKGVAGVGKHVSGEAITIDLTRRTTDELLLNDLDREVVKIFPQKTILDTLFRYATSRSTNSMEVAWMSVDTKPFTATVAAGGGYVLPGVPSTANSVAVPIIVSDSSVFAVTSTILVSSVLGYEDDGSRSTDTPLMLYVKAKNGNTLTVLAANGGKIAGTKLRFVPSIPVATELLRMGRAAQENDVQTEVSASYPTTESNYLQSFKCQVEESYWHERMDKAVDWSKEDEKEMAVYEWKLEMEGSFLNGVKSMIYDDTPGKGTVYTCNGILRYIKNEYGYTQAGWTAKDIVGLTKQAFTGNAGSDKRIFLMSTDLMAEISNIDLTQYRDVTKGVQVHWGVKFTTFTTNFGELLCLHYEQLDKCGMNGQGLVIDPNYLFKWTFEAENSRQIDNRESGVRNTKADVTTEVSCPGIKYPQCHLIVKRAA